MSKNTGKEYEEFVGSIQQILIDSGSMPNVNNITVEINKKIKDRSNIERQFDVYWEFELGGYTYKTVIECKDYASPISIEKIDAFISKVNDIPGLRPIYATKTGYQSGAKIKAEQHNIDLLIIKHPEDFDWVTSDGKPLIKTIDLRMVVEFPPRITSFRPLVDQTWLDENPSISLDSLAPMNNRIMNNMVYIVDGNTGSKISASELADTLTERIKDIQYGKGKYREKLVDSYLEFEGCDVKPRLGGFEIEYFHYEPVENSAVIDLYEQLLGIVKNYTSGEQKMVFKDGRVK